MEDFVGMFAMPALNVPVVPAFRSSNSQTKRRRFFSPALFLLQHKVILNTHFHIPVIQAIASVLPSRFSRPLSAARKKFILVTALR